MLKKNDLHGALSNYIKKNLKKGYTKESLHWALINQGYSKFEVERAVKRVEKELAEKAPILNVKPKIKYELIEPKQEQTKKSFLTRIFDFD